MCVGYGTESGEAVNTDTDYALYSLLKDMYGAVGADMAMREIDYWRTFGVLPVDAVILDDIQRAPDGSLVYVHKDWQD